VSQEYVLYESQMTGERVTVEHPLEERAGILEEIRSDLAIADWVDLEDPPMRKAAALLWAARRDRGVPAKVFGGSAFRLTCPSSNSGALRRDLNDIDYVLPPGGGVQFIEVASGLGDTFGSLHMHFLVHEDVRFNSLGGGKRYRMRMPVPHPNDQIAVKLVDVFAHSFNFCHRIDLDAVIANDALTLGLPLLILTKCQFIKALPADAVEPSNEYRRLTSIGDRRVAIGLEDKDLVDVASAFLDHELDSPELPVNAIIERTANDWGLAQTVMLNLRNNDGTRHVLAARGLPPESIDVVVGKMTAVADRIEDQIPRKPRLRFRSTWWEEVEDS
jgi:hypothetical protein